MLCFDIDGTLLDDKKKIPAPVKESLKRASARGIHIALASGRMPAGVELVEKELGIECIKICNAGTYILMGEDCIRAEHLSIASMKCIYREIARKNQVPLWVFQKRQWYVSGIDEYVEREMQIIPHIPEVVDMECLAGQWQGEGILPNKLLIAAGPEKIKSIYHDMEIRSYPELAMACSADTFIEIFPIGADKGKALTAVCDYLDIPLEDVMAFGDQELDIPMMEAAGTGVAMGNAIPKLKEKADFVTKSNNEAGIAYALEHYLK